MPLTYSWQLLNPSAPPNLVDQDIAPDHGGGKVLRDLKIDFATKRLVRLNGDFVMVTGAEAILQDVWLSLGFFEGEYFLDLTTGFPMFRLVLVKNPNMDLIQSTYRERILSRPGVKDILFLEMKFDRAARSLAVTFRISTDVGELASTGAFTIGA